MRLLTTILVLLGILACAEQAPEPAQAPPPEAMVFEQDLLGTRFRILVHHDDASEAEAAAEAAFARVRELDGILSDYDPESEVRRLGRAGAGLHTVSWELHAVLSQARDLQLRSEGAFDACAGPVTRLWRRARRRGELPDEDALRLALQRVEAADFRATLDGFQVTLAVDDMDLDLGGLAKGFVVDEALAVLTERGISAALVDGGGDLAASGPPPGREAWSVTVADLPGLDHEPLRVALVHGALATSGDTYQRLELEGTVHSHLVDPRTGQALTDRAAASVLAPRAMLADGLASALCVLEPEVGLALVASYADCATRTSRGVGDELRTWSSPEFPDGGVE